MHMRAQAHCNHDAWIPESRCKYDPHRCEVWECPGCGEHMGHSLEQDPRDPGGCKAPTVEGHLDGDETCMCGEEEWIQHPGGTWYAANDLRTLNLDGEAGPSSQ